MNRRQEMGMVMKQAQQQHHFELEETFQGYLVQYPCSEQEHLHLHQTVQSPIQPYSDCLQRQEDSVIPVHRGPTGTEDRATSTSENTNRYPNPVYLVFEGICCEDTDIYNYKIFLTGCRFWTPSEEFCSSQV